MYAFACSFLPVALIFAAVPLFRNYDIVQLILNFILNTLLFGSTNTYCSSLHILQLFVKIVSCVISAMLALHGCAVVLTVMLALIILNFEAVLQVTKHDLFPKPKQHGPLRKLLTFHGCVKTFKIVQILIHIIDHTASLFLTVLTGMGILAASASGYIVLVMAGNVQFPFILYLCCCFIFGIAVVVDFLFVTLASTPRGNGEGFKKYWKMYSSKKVEKQILRCCPIIGYSLGFLRRVKPHTALSIVDTIINITATMVLTRITRGIGIGRE